MPNRYPLILALASVSIDPPSALGQPPAFVDSAFAVRVTREIVYAPATGARAPLRLDLYEPIGPSAAASRPAFIAIHGGGLTRGDKRDAGIVELCRELAFRGYACASINYRLRGDTAGRPSAAETLRNAVDDASRALAWLTAQSGAYGINARRIVVGGSSSGATVALGLAYGPERRDSARIAGVLSWSGKFHASTDLLQPGDPPLFIVHGTADPLVDVEAARVLARRARAIALPYAVYLCQGIGHNMPLDRRPLRKSLYWHLTSFLSRSFDTASRNVNASAATRQAPELRTDLAPIACPR